MRNLLLVVAVLGGCESMAPSGHPFRPVQPAQEARAKAPGAASTAPDEPEPFEISSEELHQQYEEWKSGQADRREVQRRAPHAAQPQAPSVVPATAAPTSAAPDIGAAPPAVPPEVAPTATSWPVHLVKTLPEAQPPRAIIGLPDGQEIVVTPGSMIPDQGLVVMSVGTHQVQLARISGSGDHAVVSTTTLTAQY